MGDVAVERKRCWHCFEPNAPSSCSSCKIARFEIHHEQKRYCSRDGCQRPDWKLHKLDCPTIRAASAWSSTNSAEVLWMQGVQAWYRAIEKGSMSDFVIAVRKFRCAVEMPSHASVVQRAERLLFLGMTLLDMGEQDKTSNYIAIGRAQLEEAVALCVSLPRDDSVSRLLEWGLSELCVSLQDDKDGHREAYKAAADVATNLRKEKEEEGMSRSPWQRPGYRHPGLTSKPHWDSDSFDWVRELENSTPEILQDLKVAQTSSKLHHVGSGEHREGGQHDGSVLASGSWQEVVIFGTGAKPDAAPFTAGLLRRVLPSVVDLCERGAGEVIFSQLAPRSHITAHCAPTNLRLTAHLGLVIPSQEEECRIRVAEEWKSWRFGKVLLFDDSFEHEVCNNTDESRVVLLIRFWHPELCSEDQRHDAIKSMQSNAHALDEFRRHPPLLRSDYDRVEKSLRGGACPKCGATPADPSCGIGLSFCDAASQDSGAPLELRTACPRCHFVITKETS